MPRFAVHLLLGLLLVTASTFADENGGGPEKAEKAEKTEATGPLKGDELTLERLFPEKSPFGPAARGMAFSHDSAYGAYLYRPPIERRHGDDLWVYETASGETRRITRVSVMSAFQESARKVAEDRREKATKKREKEIAADDGGSFDGVWTGHLRGPEEMGFPPDGMKVTLTFERADDGTLGGTVVTAIAHGVLKGVELDADAATIEATISREGTELRAALEARLEDGVLRGTVTLEIFELTLELEAKRGAAAEDEDADEGAEATADLADQVDEDDAEAEKAPRYRGIGSFVWSPVANELIFASEGDLYRYVVADDAIVRLTRTQESEHGVQYLPDGAGYTYMRGNSIIQVRWDSHLIEQLDPKLPAGHQLRDYELSKDARKLVMISQKGESWWGNGTRVNIVSYRDRFAQVRQVPRHMPDDKFPELETNVYLYDRNESFAEEDELTTVFSHKHTGPRDTLRVPQWAPDSSRVTFSVFDQETGHVEIYEARLPEDEDEDEVEAAEDTEDTEDAGDAENGGTDGDGDDGDEEDEEQDGDGGDDEEEAEDAPNPAKLVYRFYHHGGPTTPSMMVPFYLADSRRIAVITEQSGYRHLQVLDPLYESMQQLTHGAYELYAIDPSPDHAYLFATANQGDPSQQHVYRVSLEDGEMTRLTHEEGVHRGAAVSPDGRHVLARHTDFARPVELVAIDVESGEAPRRLTDSHDAEAHRLAAPTPQYFTYENRHGHTIHGHMFLPAGYTPEDERPLLIYVYGGPLGTTKMATRGSLNGASYYFAYYMAEKHGYVTCTIDPRGVSGYGGLFEKSNYEQIGKPQVEDLVDGVKWFVENHGVDESRIAMHGWSFGGFQTQMCLYTEPDVFACGIAGAGPTEWENYNSWYSTGTVGKSREGETDLAKYSLLPLAKNLKAKLLLVHGMEDSNVLYQDTVKVYRELLKAGKETLVELFLDPTGGHGLGGDVKAINRYRKYEEFLVRVLGSDADAGTDAGTDTGTDAGTGTGTDVGTDTDAGTDVGTDADVGTDTDAGAGAAIETPRGYRVKIDMYAFHGPTARS